MKYVYGYRDQNGYVRAVSFDRSTTAWNARQNGGQLVRTVPTAAGTVVSASIWEDVA